MNPLINLIFGITSGLEVEDKFLKLGRVFFELRTDEVWWESDGTSMPLCLSYLGPLCKLIGVQIRFTRLEFL